MAMHALLAVRPLACLRAGQVVAGSACFFLAVRVLCSLVLSKAKTVVGLKLAGGLGGTTVKSSKKVNPGRGRFYFDQVSSKKFQARFDSRR